MPPAPRATCGCGGALVTAQKRQSACARPSMAASPRLLAGRREPPFYLSPGIATTAARPLSPIRSVVAGPFLAQASAAVRLVVDRSADFDLLVRPGFRHLELIESAPRDPWPAHWPAHWPALAPAWARRKLFLHW